MTILLYSALLLFPVSRDPAASELRFSPTPGSPFRVGPMAGRPAIGDMNGDGKPDVVVACGTCCGLPPDPESGHIVVLLGDGKGSLQSAPGSPHKVGPSVRKLVLGDFDEDGKLDVAAAEHDTYLAHVYRGDGKGGLSGFPGSPFTTHAGVRPHTHEIACGDVDADGHLDLLTTNANDAAVSVLLGDGKGGFAPAKGSPFRAGRHPYDRIALGDLDGDKKTDLVVPDTAGNAVTVPSGDGHGAFAAAPGSPCGVGPRPGYLELGDWNGDGRLDCAVTHDDDPLLVLLLNDGHGKLMQTKGSRIETPERVWGAVAADLDGDGKDDLVLGTAGRNGPMILLGDRQGGFGAPLQVEKPKGEAPGYVAVADLDGDKRPDIVTSEFESGTVSIYLSKSGKPSTDR